MASGSTTGKIKRYSINTWYTDGMDDTDFLSFTVKSVLVRRMLNTNGRLSLRGTKQSHAWEGRLPHFAVFAFAMTRIQGAPDYHIYPYHPCTKNQVVGIL
jgi:hypothetical protein